MKIIQKRKIWFTLSGVLIVLSILSFIFLGLKPAIDFVGGSLLEVQYLNERPSSQEIKDRLVDLNLGSLNIQPSGEKNLILRFKQVDEQTHQNILEKLGAKKEKSPVTIEAEGGTQVKSVDLSIAGEEELSAVELRFESIGPAIGKEMQKKAVYSIIIVLIAIILYIAWAFRKVSKPVASWKYGIIAIIALCHDIIIVMGVFSVLSYFLNIEIGLPFVAALLTILGYSVNDSIVVFDRIRENLFRFQASSFEETINNSVNQTITRSINTSLTTLLVLLAIFFFGGVTIKYFVLALAIGVASGTYSSIFLASPLLVVWERLFKR